MLGAGGRSARAEVKGGGASIAAPAAQLYVAAMSRSILVGVVLAALALSAGCQQLRQKGEQKNEARHAKISLGELPAEVRKGFERDFPGARITEAEKETYADGTIHYEIEYTAADGKDADVEYSASGEQLDAH